MKQPGVLLVLVIFVAAVSFVVASEGFKNGTKTTVLNGVGVVNTPGDPDGTGILKFTLRADEGKFCYDLTVANISSATSASLNFGPRGGIGQSVAALQPPVKGSSVDCIALDADRLGDIVRNPTSYYVEVQNQEFPGGALRGQLK